MSTINDEQNNASDIRSFSTSLFFDMFKNSLKLSKLLWREKRNSMILLGIIFLIVSGAPFLQSGFRGLLINKLIPISDGYSPNIELFLIIGGLIAATFIPSFLYSIQGYLSKIFGFFLEEKFETLVTKKKGDLDIATHENPQYQDLFNRVNENGTWRTRNFVDRQYFVFQNIIEVIIASIILIFSEWWVFLIILVGTFPELIIEIIYGQDTWSIHFGRSQTRRKFWEFQGHFNTTSSLIELKLFQNLKYFFLSIKDLFKEFQTEEKKNEKKRLAYNLLSLCFSQFVIAFAIVYFTMQVIHGNLLIGTLTFVLASIGDLRQALSGLFSNIGHQYQDSLFVSDMFRLLELETAVKQPANGMILAPKKTPEIIFENVSFAYPDTKKCVLKNFSMKISPGEKIALVGVNGAGKTTLVKLLCRFYDPDKGRILIDGRDLKEVDIESWYSKIGALFQDYAKYHILVKEAIALGNTNQKSTKKKIEDAAKNSEAETFINDWDKKYEQMLGKEFSEGVEPSIGQWQKLALARTFYREPNIFILDEPTSSIDAEAETKIFEKLEKLPEDRTVILISHRFSTVRRADKIGVIENGELREFDSHKNLLKNGKTYARLFKMQAKGYE